jgi:N-acetylmuramoyl-L-alanine amidase
MDPRVHRFILGSLLALFAASSAAAVDSAVRPTTAADRSTQGKTLSMPELAAKLGLKLDWTQTAVKVTLSDGSRRVVLEADSREMVINGLRVFLGSPVTVNHGQLYVSVIDFETCLVPLLRPSMARHRPPHPKVIAIDAGHGGVDQGTENHRLEFKEKIFTLDVVLRLKSLLEKQGYVVVLTRATDMTVDKAMRVVIANRAGADLFLSVHFNALPNDQKTRGTEVFTFAPQFQRSTNSWSPLEPDDTEREASPGNDFDPWNSLLAHALHRELLVGLKTFDRGKKIAHLGVLRGLNCPGVLVESGFLSNDEEARKIATEAYRQQIAVALATGVKAYANQLDAIRSRP